MDHYKIQVSYTVDIWVESTVVVVPATIIVVITGPVRRFSSPKLGLEGRDYLPSGRVFDPQLLALLLHLLTLDVVVVHDHRCLTNLHWHIVSHQSGEVCGLDEGRHIGVECLHHPRQYRVHARVVLVVDPRNLSVDFLVVRLDNTHTFSSGPMGTCEKCPRRRCCRLSRVTTGCRISWPKRAWSVWIGVAKGGATAFTMSIEGAHVNMSLWLFTLLLVAHHLSVVSPFKMSPQETLSYVNMLCQVGRSFSFVYGQRKKNLMAK